MPEAAMLGTCWCTHENLVPEKCQGMRVVLDMVSRGTLAVTTSSCNITWDLLRIIFFTMVGTMQKNKHEQKTDVPSHTTTLVS